MVLVSNRSNRRERLRVIIFVVSGAHLAFITPVPLCPRSPKAPTTCASRICRRYRTISAIVRGWAGSITETHSFGATAINEFRIAYRNYIQARQGQNFDLKPWTLVPAVPVQNTGGLPTVTFSGYTGLTDWGAGIDFPTYDVEFSDNFTKIHGRHTFKAGILETGYKFSVPGSDGRLTIQLGSYNGSFGSTGAWTGGKGFAGLAPSQGNGFADFLLGDLSSTNYATLVNSTLLSSP